MTKQNVTVVESLINELEDLIFTAARGWERRVTIRQEDRDHIIAALRKGAALTVSPPPEEIAELIERLKFRANPRVGAHSVEMKAAAALEQMGRERDVLRAENQRLLDGHDFLVRKQVERIRQLEGESLQANAACDAQIRRANRAEAERDDLKKAYSELVEDTRNLRNEAYEQGKSQAEAGGE